MSKTFYEVKVMENNTNTKGNIVELLKNFKDNAFLVSLVAFVVVMLALILVAIFGLREFVVSVCVIAIIETMMAVLLHKAELWKHAVLVVAQIIAGVIIGRIPLIIICVLMYLAAMFALHFMFKNTNNSPKA